MEAKEKLGPPAKKPEFGRRGTVSTSYKPLVPLPGENKLFVDLEKYRQMALDLGAHETIIIPASEFPQDIRVWWKCQLPRCLASGANPYCPPLWKTPWEDAKRIKNSYRYAIVFNVKRPPQLWTGRNILTREFNAAIAKFLPSERREQAIKELDDLVKWQNESKKLPREQRTIGTASIGPRIVEQARKDGHYFAVTFGVGSCQLTRCARYGAVCVAVTTGLCRFPLKVSPEGSAAMYQDFTTLSAKMGWHTEVAGYCIQPEDAQEAEYFQFGSVFIE